VSKRGHREEKSINLAHPRRAGGGGGRTKAPGGRNPIGVCFGRGVEKERGHAIRSVPKKGKKNLTNEIRKTFAIDCGTRRIKTTTLRRKAKSKTS